MPFKSISSLVSHPGRRGRSPSSDTDIVFATDVAGGKYDPGRYAMRIGVPAEIAKKARLIKGDRVDILFDETNGVGLIRRVTEGGWKIGSPHPGGRLYLKITICPGMPTVAKPASCPCEITDDGITFILPSEHSFTENLRAKAAATTPASR